MEHVLVNRQMWTRPATWVAAGLWILILGIATAIVAMKTAGWQGAGNTNDTTGATLFLALFAFATMGALVAARVPRNAIGWIFLAIPFCGAIAGLTENLAVQGLVHDPGSLPAATAFAWVYSWVWYPTIGLLGFVLLLYPTGAVPGPRWRPVAALSMAGLVFAAVVSVIVRFRRSHDDERQQMKWMAFAAAVLATGFVLQSALALGGDIAFSIAISALPVALGIAMFKYRLYDVDRVINKTLVYGASSALLAGAYLGFVIAGEAVFEPIARGSSVAVALSTLIVAALFLPVRTRVQRFVDRRFYRSKVDSEEMLARFGARLRREADLDTLLAGLSDAVHETFQPTEVWLWMRAEDFGARNDPGTVTEYNGRR